MHLHEPVTWQLDDKKLKLGQNAFNYEREIMTTEDKITVIHNYKPLSDVIAVAEIDAFVKDIKQARDELYYTVLLPNKNDSKLKLRDKMRSMLKL
jgi:negative regulator of genetic competence, sporulation and motility